MFKNHAGGYGLATLCGSLGVAAFIIGQFVPADDAKKMIAELFNWYKGFSFPVYQPDYNGELKTTVADSYLCDDSVGNYMTAENVEYGDKKRKSRCAGLASDVTKKTIELLNAYFKM